MLVVIILILILTLIGVLFFKLAKKFEKSKLKFVALGVFSFAVGIFVYIGFYIKMIDLLPVLNRYIHEFLCFTTGIVFALVVYIMLRKKWRNTFVAIK